MPRIRFAVAAATAMLALCPAPSRADTVIDLHPAPERHHTQDMHAIIDELEVWLDRQTDWPRRAEAPRIRLVSEWQAAARRGITGSAQRGHLRGLYDPDHAEILMESVLQRVVSERQGAVGEAKS